MTFRWRFMVFWLLFPFGLQAYAEDRPNVLFIIVDDLNDMPLHPTGKPFVPTPNFDRLAKQGVSFTNAHCNDPICAPSRSSMLTGLYPQTSSLYWFEDYRQNAVLSQSKTLTEHLDSPFLQYLGASLLSLCPETGIGGHLPEKRKIPINPVCERI